MDINIPNFVENHDFLPILNGSTKMQNLISQQIKAEIANNIHKLITIDKISMDVISAFFDYLKSKEKKIPIKNLAEFIVIARQFEMPQFEKTFSLILNGSINNNHTLVQQLYLATKIPNSEYAKALDEISLQTQRINHLLQTPHFDQLDVHVIFRLFNKIQSKGLLGEISQDSLYDLIEKDIEHRYILFQFLDLHKLSAAKYNLFMEKVEQYSNSNEKEYLSFLKFPSGVLCDHQKYLHYMSNQPANDSLQSDFRRIGGKLVDKIIKLYKLTYENGNLINIPDATFDRTESFDLDWKDAFDYFTYLDNENNECGTNNLAFCYQHGLGVVSNLETAIKKYEKVSGNNFYAVYNMGFCYQKGIGVKTDTNQAIKLFQAASEHGINYAKDRLAEITKQ